jgi:hypothetical protein
MHFGGDAPDEIIQFLLDSYQLYYPDQVFNWTMMVETIGRCDTLKESIRNLLQVKQMHFPDQSIDCNFLSCAACQTVCKLLPFKFGVIISQT